MQDYNSGPITGLDNQFHTMGDADFHIAMTDMLLTGFPVAGKTRPAPRRRSVHRRRSQVYQPFWLVSSPSGNMPDGGFA